MRRLCSIGLALSAARKGARYAACRKWPYTGGAMDSSLYTTFLFASPSFMEGMGRILDLGGYMTEYNVSPTGHVADWIAFTSDWAVIGEDLRTAIRRRAEIHAQEPSRAPTR